MGRSLRALLAYSPAADVESVFGLTFEAPTMAFGAAGSVEIVPGGAAMPVTGATRAHYVETMVRHRLVTSIRPQLAAFRRGFSALCSGPAISLFRPQELELLVCGNPDLDFAALERGARYGEGYTTASRVIRWFWETVHPFTADEKRRLLSFVTGSDRVPVKGLSSLPFCIQRNGPASERLPTAHTCFNVLLLPEYGSKATLERCLRLAIDNSEGFGLR